MCRFVAYHGPPIRLDELLYGPAHSIVKQSTDARERPEPLNGDGWGVGWYEPERSPEPAVYREVRPAWGDENMRRISPLVETPVYVAHVRAASPGLAVHERNCHPFPGGEHTLEDRRDRDPVVEGRQELLFAHNGAIGGYRDVVRRLREDLDDGHYFSIHGSTDSEHAFALVQQYLGDDAADPSLADLVDAVEATIEHVERLRVDVGAGEDPTDANFCLTDGERVVATRYASECADAAQTLHVGEAGGFVADGEYAGAVDPDDDAATLVASEPLFEDDRVWRDVPRNHRVTVAADGTTRVDPLDVDVP
ncbi:class II glutamine amidotransferase [Halorubellus sp. PRR65]|uniref:class II glutamine amidotransferase n=1 Tax=Halorubellus sp. PRR65 TaxID=3098148 RepID=UPI002B257D89|nr:class II glutamine amidotransferase [Halorubellus sp. PRR65]